MPVTFIPSPLLVHGMGVNDGVTPSDVFVSGLPGQQVTVAECVYYPDVERDLDSCVVPTPLTLDANGLARVELLFPREPTVDGVAVSCANRPCHAVVFDDAGTVVSARDLFGSPPSAELTLDRASDLLPHDVVEATVTNRGRA